MESLYQYSKDQTNFLNTHESGVRKLPIFEQIHNEGAEEDADEEASEVFECADDSELSFIEMEEDIIAFCDPDIKSPTADEEQSALNTTIGSSQEGSVSAEVAQKNDDDLVVVGKAICFDIAAQMNLAIDGDNDLSFDSIQNTF